MTGQGRTGDDRRGDDRTGQDMTGDETRRQERRRQEMAGDDRNHQVVHLVRGWAERWVGIPPAY